MELRRFLESSGTLLGQRIVGAVLSFLLPVYLANVISPATLGSYFLFVSFQGLLGLLAMFGMGAAIIKYISASNDHSGSYLGAGILSVGCTTTVIILVSYLFRNQIESYISQQVWSVLAIGVVVMVAANLYSTILIGEDRIPTNAMTSFVGQLIGIPTQFVVATLGFIPLILAYNLRFLIILLLAFGYVKTTPKLPSLSTVATTASYGSRAVISNIEERAFQWTDLFVIGFFLGNAAAGIYGAVWAISSIAFMPTRAIGTTLLPEVSKMEGEERTGQIAEVISLSVFASVAFALPILGGAILVGRELLTILFQPTYATAASVLVVALAGRVFHGLHRVSRNGLLALNKPDITFKIGIASIVMNITMNLYLVPRFGILGAALATTISIVGASFPFLYYISSIATDPILPLKGISQSVFSTGIMMALLLLLITFRPPKTPILLAAMIAFGGIVYWGLMIILNDQLSNGARQTLEWLRRGLA